MVSSAYFDPGMYYNNIFRANFMNNFVQNTGSDNVFNYMLQNGAHCSTDHYCVVKHEEQPATPEASKKEEAPKASTPAQPLVKPKVKLSQSFLTKVKELAGRLNCDYKDLLAVMNSESGMNSRATNKRTSATGLIQFMPTTAKSLGTSTDAIRQMSPEKQLVYVEKYFKNAKKIAGITSDRKLTAGDLYTLVFMPAKANKDVIVRAGTKAYNSNKGLDLNGDGVITKDELAQRVNKKRIDESIFV